MTRDEFLMQYHFYHTYSDKVAQDEADKVNKIGVDGSTVKVVSFGDLGYCLMLDTAIDALNEIGILPVRKD